jgi:hypothetical protein
MTRAPAPAAYPSILRRQREMVMHRGELNKANFRLRPEARNLTSRRPGSMAHGRPSVMWADNLSVAAK